MKKVRCVKLKLMMLMLIATAITAYAAPPTQAELDAFKAAVDLYEQSQAALVSQGALPGEGALTPDELKTQAIAAFNDFITTYPDSELNPVAQNSIAFCYHKHNDNVNAKVEFTKLITNYPESILVDDAKYQIAFIDFVSGDYESALTEFEDLITDYEGNTNEMLSHKVPFAYFMAGECYRKLNDMTSAKAKWNELIVKYPDHSQAGRAQKRIDQ